GKANPAALGALRGGAAIVGPAELLTGSLIAAAQPFGRGIGLILLLVVAGVILLAQRYRVHVQGPRQFIHGRFQRKGPFDKARRAKGDAWPRVDVDSLLHRAYIGAAVE